MLRECGINWKRSRAAEVAQPWVETRSGDSRGAPHPSDLQVVFRRPFARILSADSPHENGKWTYANKIVRLINIWSCFCAPFWETIAWMACHKEIERCGVGKVGSRPFCLEMKFLTIRPGTRRVCQDVLQSKLEVRQRAGCVNLIVTFFFFQWHQSNLWCYETHANKTLSVKQFSRLHYFRARQFYTCRLFIVYFVLFLN